MMKRTIFESLLAIFVCLFFLFCAQPVSAHNTEPRLEISVDRLNSGGVVNVRGVNFGMDDSVRLTLIGSDVEILMGEMMSSGEGELMHIVELPPDLAEGTYYFRAVTTHHFVLSPPLTVQGTAILEGGDQGGPDEDDPLPAPLPTFAPGVIPGVAPASTSSVTVEAPRVASGWSTNILLLVALMVFVALFVLRLGRKRVE